MSIDDMWEVFTKREPHNRIASLEESIEERNKCIKELEADNERLWGAAMEMLEHSFLEEGDALWSQDYEVAKRNLKAALEEVQDG